MGCNNSKTKKSATSANTDQQQSPRKKNERKAHDDKPKTQENDTAKVKPIPSAKREVEEKKDQAEEKPGDNASSHELPPRTTMRVSCSRDHEAAPESAATGAAAATPPNAESSTSSLMAVAEPAAEPERVAGETPQEGDVHTPAETAAEVKREEGAHEGEKKEADVAIRDGAHPTVKALEDTKKKEVELRAATAAAEVAAEKATVPDQASPLSPTNVSARAVRQRIVKPVPDRFLQAKSESDVPAPVFSIPSPLPAAAAAAEVVNEDGDDKKEQPDTSSESYHDVDVDDPNISAPESNSGAVACFSHRSDDENIRNADAAAHQQETGTAVYGSEWGNDTADRKVEEVVDEAKPSPAASYNVISLTYVDTPQEVSTEPEKPRPSPKCTGDRSRQLHPEVYKKMPVSPSENVSTVKASRRQPSPAYPCMSDGRTPSVGRHPSHTRMGDTKSSSEAASRSHSANVSVKKEVVEATAGAVKSVAQPSTTTTATAATVAHEQRADVLEWKKSSAKASVPPRHRDFPVKSSANGTTLIPKRSRPLVVHTRPSNGSSPVTVTTPPTASTELTTKKMPPSMPAKTRELTRKPRSAVPTTMKCNSANTAPYSTVALQKSTTATAAMKKTLMNTGAGTDTVRAAGASSASTVPDVKRSAHQSTAVKSKTPGQQQHHHPAAWGGTHKRCADAVQNSVPAKEAPKTYADAVREGVHDMADAPKGVAAESAKEEKAHLREKGSEAPKAYAEAVKEGAHEDDAPKSYADAVKEGVPADVVQRGYHETSPQEPPASLEPMPPAEERVHHQQREGQEKGDRLSKCAETDGDSAAAGERAPTEQDSDAEKEVELPAAQRHNVNIDSSRAYAFSTSASKTVTAADSKDDASAIVGDGTVAVMNGDKNRTEDQLMEKAEPEWHVVPSAEPIERPSILSQAKTVMNMRNLTAI